jgi:hypothetical protein
MKRWIIAVVVVVPLVVVGMSAFKTYRRPQHKQRIESHLVNGA